MNKLELLSIGDASLDVFVTPTESETHCRVDDKECFLCFSYGDKIPVKSLDFSIGGNAVNNAVGHDTVSSRNENHNAHAKNTVKEGHNRHDGWR